MKGKHEKEPEKTNKKKYKQKKIKKRLIINIALLILIVVFLYSSYQVLNWLKSDKQTKDLEEGLFSEVVKEENNSGEEENTTEIDFAKLEEVNPDVIAWIKIEDTYINYPIMQGRTDEYYLRKDINKKYNIAGSIFVYSNVSPDFSDENTVIYGHNMKNGRMFSNLAKIYNGDLGKDVYVEIYTKENNFKYKVISSYIEEPNLPLIQRNFTEEEKIDYINKVVKKSKIDFKQESYIDYKENIITLITCDSAGTQRVIVHAVQV